MPGFFMSDRYAGLLKEEESINKGLELHSAGTFQCSTMASIALSGQPSFPDVEAGTFWLGNLRRQIRSGSE